MAQQVTSMAVESLSQDELFDLNAASGSSAPVVNEVPDEVMKYLKK